jgi:hypothetical protein
VSSSVDDFIQSLNGRVRPIVKSLHESIVGLGCESYVKTIYIGYSISGEMVAASYPHQDFVEVALALPEDHGDPRLFDCSHLKWRTLPLAARLNTVDEIESLQPLLQESAVAVAAGSHGVQRSTEYFTKLPRRTPWYK